MNLEIDNRKDQDLGRGVALTAAGAAMVLLKFVIPWVAPLAIAAYGIYQLFRKNYWECAIMLGAAVLLFFLQGLVEWILLLCGAGMAGFGLFFLVRGIRGQYLID